MASLTVFADTSITSMKMKEQQDKLNAYASMSTKNIQKKANISSNA